MWQVLHFTKPFNILYSRCLPVVSVSTSPPITRGVALLGAARRAANTSKGIQRELLSHRIGQAVNSEWQKSCRWLSSAQVATALRPFYFLVHPDLFGQHPRAQHINDASLKTLNSHLDSLVQDQKPGPVNLQFYIKSKKIQGTLSMVAMDLNKASTRATVHGILNEFDLPTKYVDSLPEPPRTPDRKINWDNYYNPFSEYPQDQPITHKKRQNL